VKVHVTLHVALFDPVLRDENDSSQQDQGVLPVEEQWYDDQYNGDGDDFATTASRRIHGTTMPMNTRTILMKITDRKQN
jgi:hypothetical protein